uniref:Uncharacterized protein n=1 Tax=Arundo donax TaxID=35708 RepID=A0A0A9CJ70_ARUDO
MSTMSSCLAEESASIPGRDAAISRNSGLMLNPAFALVSMNMAPCSCALASPSSAGTFLLSTRSVLFPTRKMSTSPLLCVCTSSIHFDVFKKDCLSVTS